MPVSVPEAPRSEPDAFGLAVRCEGVVHLYRTVQGHDVVALHGVDLAIEPGERVALLGPSGSGKSTLLALLGGVQRPSVGSILLGDRDIARIRERELAELRASTVSTLLQGAERNLLSYATVRQNIEFARLAVPRARRRELPAPEELLERVRLVDHGDQAVARLSGGQRQRAALAAAVAVHPRVLLADEPTSQLGDDDRDLLLGLIHGIGEELGATVVVVTHDPDVSATFPRTVTIKSGRVGSEGRDGTEYVVIGPEGVLQLPAHLVEQWPQGTMVRIEPEDEDLLLSREGRA